MKPTVKIPIVLKHPLARAPSQNSEGDAAFDVYAVDDVVIPPMGVAKVKTGLHVAGQLEWHYCSHTGVHGLSYFFKLEGRSGLATKGIFPIGGIIDSSYRGEICGILANLNDTPYTVKAGDRFAQMIVYTIIANTSNVDVRFVEVESIEETVRGEKGFGSSGT